MDYAAATPLDEDVEEAMRSYGSESFFNPSSTYLPAKKVKRALDDARASVAMILGVKPQEVIFTAGGTEANNLAIQGVMRRFPNCSVLVSGVEHDSVLKTAEKFNCSVLLVDEKGRADVSDISSKITDTTVLVSVTYANSEIGTIQPIRQIADEIEKIRSDRKLKGNSMPLYLHTDACQAAGVLDLQAKRLGVDMITLNGGKIYGPKQSGALYVASYVELEPLIYGGGQERGMRSGTEGVAGSVGFSLALDKSQSLRHEESKRLSDLQKKFFNLLRTRLPKSVINGDLKHRLPGNVHITLPGTDNERILILLERAGVLASAGTACSASDDEPSHVLRAIGFSDEDARASLRFTMGRGTTESDVEAVVDRLVEITSNSR